MDSQALKTSQSYPTPEKPEYTHTRRYSICDLNTLNNELHYVDFSSKNFAPRTFGTSNNHHRRNSVALRFLLPKAEEDVGLDRKP